jgi:hypothetical protein
LPVIRLLLVMKTSSIAACFVAPLTLDDVKNAAVTFSGHNDFGTSDAKVGWARATFSIDWSR